MEMKMRGNERKIKEKRKEKRREKRKRKKGGKGRNSGRKTEIPLQTAERWTEITLQHDKQHPKSE
jgi:hypothetical protein